MADYVATTRQIRSLSSCPGAMSRNSCPHDPRTDGLGASRYGLEFQVPNHVICSSRNELYSNEMRPDCYKTLHTNQLSGKTTGKDDLLVRSNSRKNMPTIVARLMGVDSLPVEEHWSFSSVPDQSSYLETDPHNGSSSSREMELDAFYPICWTDSDGSNEDRQIANIQRREHPQEEELQKFKMEFVAWQAAQSKHRSEDVEPRNCHHSSMVSPEINHETSPCEERRAFSRKKMMDRATEHAISAKFRRKDNRHYEAKTIVILRPGAHCFMGRGDHPLNSSSASFEDRSDIGELLEEVNQRLKNELNGTESDENAWISENPRDSKEVARRTALLVREKMIRDLGLSFPQPESSILHSDGTEMDETNSDLINRNSKRFPSDRFWNARVDRSETTKSFQEIWLGLYRHRYRDPHSESFLLKIAPCLNRKLMFCQHLFERKRRRNEV